MTPTNAGDFRGEMPRQIDIRLLPQGIILPSNPNLVAAFTFTPAAPRILDTVTFDATTSANGGSACGANCTYVWNFGDGTTGAGVVVTHQFRAVNTYPVTLTVTDQRGAQATLTEAGARWGRRASNRVVYDIARKPRTGQEHFLQCQ